jgi:hypothetical protein
MAETLEYGMFLSSGKDDWEGDGTGTVTSPTM